MSVLDQERANVRPPNPSLCVGNGFVIEVTDLVRFHRPLPFARPYTLIQQGLSLRAVVTPCSWEAVSEQTGGNLLARSEEHQVRCLIWTLLMWPYQVFKAYDTSGKFLAGPVSIVDFFSAGLGGRFSDAHCTRTQPPHLQSHFPTCCRACLLA